MVVKEVIKAAIISMQNELKDVTDQQQSIELLADRLSTIIANAILSATVLPGITVSTPDTINGVTTTPGTLQ